MTALGIFTFLQTATHFLFVSCEAAKKESTLQDDMYVSSLPIYQNGDFCILETNYLLYKRSATIAAYRNFPFGLGLGQHTHFLQKLSFEPLYIEKYKGQSGDTHCVYTGMLGELGILGFIAVIAIFYFLFLNANAIGLGFSSVVLFFVLEAINTDIFNFRHFWIFIALTLAVSAKKRLS